MQKKIIALAVAGLVSGAAFAQSNVTVYGIADVYYAYARGNDSGGQNSSNHINSGGLGGSRIGFRGTEDLGNGLSAVFALEYALALDQNNGILGDQAGNRSRQQYVGLSSKTYGTLVAGHLQAPGFTFSCATNPLAGGALDAQGKLGVATLLNCGASGRTHDSFAYSSPSWNGLSFEYAHGRLTENDGGNQAGAVATNSTLTTTNSLHGRNATTDTDTKANLLHVKYTNGAFDAGFAWTKIDGSLGSAVGFTDDVTEWGARASYDFKVAKVFGHYQRTNDDRAASTADNNSKYGLGVSVPVTANGTLYGLYAKRNMDANNLDAHSYTLAYIHAMSKRTKLYAGYNHVSNDRAATQASLVTPDASDSSSTFYFGINHGF